MKKRYTTKIFMFIILSLVGYATSANNVIVGKPSATDDLRQEDPIRYFLNNGQQNTVYVCINDTLYPKKEQSDLGKVLWWVPFFPASDTICIAAKELEQMPAHPDTMVWAVLFDQHKIVFYEPHNAVWDSGHKQLLQKGHATAKELTLKGNMSTGAIVSLLILCLLGVAEGILAIFLLWKLCRKNKVVSTRTRKSRGEKIHQYKEILKTLRPKKTDDPIANLRTLIANANKGKALQSDHQKLLDYCENLMNNPAIVLGKRELSDTELYKVMKDLNALQETDNISTLSLESNQAKKATKALTDMTEHYAAIQALEPYFRRISDDTKDFFYHKMSKNSAEENTRLFLFYLSQLHSVAAVMRNNLDPNNIGKYYSTSLLESHTKNVEQFKLHGSNISSFQNMEPVYKRQDANYEDALFAYLNKYQPLDFILFGYNFQPRLK